MPYMFLNEYHPARIKAIMINCSGFKSGIPEILPGGVQKEKIENPQSGSGFFGSFDAT